MDQSTNWLIDRTLTVLLFFYQICITIDMLIQLNDQTVSPIFMPH